MSDRRRRRWIALDVMFFGSGLSVELLDQFGPAGVVVWVAFLCACKRNSIEGRITVLSDEDAIGQLGLAGLELVDGAGDKWELDDLWKRLGQLKQTSRRRRGHVTDIIATRWEQWQYTASTDLKAERMASYRARNAGTVRPPTRQDKT